MKISHKQMSQIVSKVAQVQAKVGKRLPLQITGVHGIGKTQGIQELTKEGFEVSILNLSTQEVSDLIGIPKTRYITMNEDGSERILSTQDAQSGKIANVIEQTIWAQPEWFKHTEKPVIYFLDEFNRADDMVLQTMLPFALEGRLHCHFLKPNDVVVTAINPNSEDYVTNDFQDMALQDRFAHFILQPKSEEFKVFLMKQDIDESILNLIDEEGDLLNITNIQNIDVPKPSPRKLDTVGTYLKEFSEQDIKDFGYAFLTACFGITTGNAAYKAKLNQFKVLNVSDIFNGKYKTKIQSTEVEQIVGVLHKLAKIVLDKKFVNKGVETDLVDKNIDSINDFLRFCPKDTVKGNFAKIMKSLADGDSAALIAAFNYLDTAGTKAPKVTTVNYIMK